MVLSLSMNAKPHTAVAQRDVAMQCGSAAFIRPSLALGATRRDAAEDQS